MPASGARGGLAALGAALALAAALAPSGCGKKAPLRLPDSRPAEQAPALRARVREGRVTLDFAVPSRRVFPEREPAWVLARILRRAGAGADAERTEAGAILEPKGFAFDAPLSWTDAFRPPGPAVVYQVEFRDADRRRRAVTGEVPVGWDAVPPAPAGLVAEGSARAVALSWAPPQRGGARFRVYRRAAGESEEASASPDPVSGAGFTDTRVSPGRAYCYRVRAVLDVQGIEVEGPAGAEACAETAGPPAPPPEPPAPR
jgi:predicted small lipoprotein YifL